MNRLEALIQVDDCKHVVVRYDGVQEQADGSAGLKLYTCIPPPEYMADVKHCRGTFVLGEKIALYNPVQGFDDKEYFMRKKE